MFIDHPESEIITEDIPVNPDDCSDSEINTGIKKIINPEETNRPTSNTANVPIEESTTEKKNFYDQKLDSSSEKNHFNDSKLQNTLDNDLLQGVEESSSENNFYQAFEDISNIVDLKIPNLKFDVDRKILNSSMAASNSVFAHNSVLRDDINIADIVDLKIVNLGINLTLKNNSEKNLITGLATETESLGNHQPTDYKIFIENEDIADIVDLKIVNLNIDSNSFQNQPHLRIPNSSDNNNVSESTSDNNLSKGDKNFNISDIVDLKIVYLNIDSTLENN